jgi:hypothetical protein
MLYKGQIMTYGCNSEIQRMNYGCNSGIQIMTYGSNSEIQIMTYGCNSGEHHILDFLRNTNQISFCNLFIFKEKQRQIQIQKKNILYAYTILPDKNI